MPVHRKGISTGLILGSALSSLLLLELRRMGKVLLLAKIRELDPVSMLPGTTSTSPVLMIQVSAGPTVTLLGGAL